MVQGKSEGMEMTRRRYDSFESVRRRAGMGERLGAKDKEYAWYAGGSFEIASRMAMVDTMLKNGLIPDGLIPLVKLYRSYLDQQRKAFLTSVGSDIITKLGVLLGLRDDRISAT